MGKDRDIFNIFGDYLAPGSGAVNGDEKFPRQHPGSQFFLGDPDNIRNRASIVRLLEENPCFSKWFYEDKFRISDDAIRRGINLISQIYPLRDDEAEWESVLRSFEGEPESKVFETLIHIASRSIGNDLSNNKGRKIRAMIEQSPLPILDTLVGNDDVREGMTAGLFNEDDLEMLVVASAIITMARTAIEDGDKIVRAGE